MTEPRVYSRRLVIDRPRDPKGRRYIFTGLPDWVTDLDSVKRHLRERGVGSFLADYPDLDAPGIEVVIENKYWGQDCYDWQNPLVIKAVARVGDFGTAAADSVPQPGGTHQVTVVVGEPDAVRDAGTLLNNGTSVEVPKFSDLFPSGKSYAYDGTAEPPRAVAMTPDEEKALASLREAEDAVMRVLSAGQTWAFGMGTAAQGMFTQLRASVLARVAARAFLDKVR